MRRSRVARETCQLSMLFLARLAPVRSVKGSSMAPVSPLRLPTAWDPTGRDMRPRRCRKFTDSTRVPQKHGGAECEPELGAEHKVTVP